ncbi:MAG: hypothetical protein CMC08_10040 [Flavobacteriaceae bacterium]|nr:hypothetical protein [Flavobacteriaceae bacterium]
MSSFSIIQQKLEQFIKKYYTNELIKGIILFFSIGLLYFLATLLVEYFLWLAPQERTLLFWLFVVVELLLLGRFVFFPLAKLFKLQQGLSYEEASRIIGDHFPEVRDKLINVIQLNSTKIESELLAASIDQKAAALQPIPFQTAVNFRTNTIYLKYAILPVMLFVLIGLLGEEGLFKNSYNRVVNYRTAYEPPAPFQFVILNDSLSAIENKPFTLQLQTVGKLIPETVRINYNDETYILRQSALGQFQYTFSQPVDAVDFRFEANEVSSREYTLEVIKTPTLLGFDMQLNYPAYTGKKDETLNSTGNAIIPEGTRVTWQLRAKNTENVVLKMADTLLDFSKEENEFKLNRRIFSNTDYTLTTSNMRLRNYENLSFSLGVIKDSYPDIEVEAKVDSTNSQVIYYLGSVSDDYGLSKLQLVYYPEGSPQNTNTVPLPLSKSTFDQFTYTFPADIDLEDDEVYEYYFQVFDNDGVNGAKSSKSAVYSYRKLTQAEQEREQLENQQNTIEGMDKTLDELREQEKALENLSKLQKEKKELNYNDRRKLEDFLKRQKQQEEMMKNFSKELKEQLEEFQPDKEETDPFKEQLEKRLEENERQLEENEELLKELEELQEKIQKEDLTEKLEKLAKQNKNQEKNLEQLVELTKRYYVTKKAEKLAEELYKLGEEQEKLANSPKEENTVEKQEELNKAFEEYKEEMDKLQEENQDLKSPMDIPENPKEEEQIQQEQQGATDDLKKQQQENAKPKQNKAGQKMKKMGKQIQMQMMSGQMETIEEDVEMLRQILDNLVVFSFEQEDIMDQFKSTSYGNPTFGMRLNLQNDLKLNFQHIDDSIFALSLRQPLISTKINESLTDVQYNLDKALDRLAENEMRQGISSQQYTVTGANELAVLLSDLLENMQNQMQMAASGQGQGKGQGQGQGEIRGFQLPDIIEKQESLTEQMKEGMKEGKGQSKGEGEGEGEGDGKGDGNGDTDGNSGKNGENSGNEGQSGEGNNESMNGALFEIYKQQQQLRQQLEDRLNKEGLGGAGGDLLRKMEGIEQQLLERGFNQRTLEQMRNLKYELLKLDEASFQQGQEEKRESQFNRNRYRNNVRLSPGAIKEYFNTTEILNREALPLRLEFKQKVQQYFKKGND